LADGYTGIAILFSVAAAVSIMFRRLKLPLILGYMLAGLLAAPFLESDSSIIALISDMGISLLAFTMGMELSLSLLRRLGHRTIMAGMVEVSLMIPVGYLAGRFLGWSDMTALFFAAAFALTSTTIVTKTMRDTRETLKHYSDALFGLLVIEDMITVVILAVLSAFGNSQSPSVIHLLYLVAGFIFFAITALLMAVNVLPRVINRVIEMGSDEVILIFSLGMCFALALFADALGFSFVIGAFIVGVAVAESEHRERIHQKMVPIRDVFLAVFFVSIGTLIQVQYVPLLIPWALLLAGIFVLWKMFSVTFGMGLAGSGARDALFIGIGAGALGEFSFVVARLGIQFGYMNNEMYTLIVLMSVVTMVTLPALIRKNEKIYEFAGRKTPLRLKMYVITLAAFVEQVRERSHSVRRNGNGSRHFAVNVFMNLLTLIALFIMSAMFVSKAQILMQKSGTEFPLLYLVFTLFILLILYASFNTLLIDITALVNGRGTRSTVIKGVVTGTLQAVYLLLAYALIAPTFFSFFSRTLFSGVAVFLSGALILFLLWKGIRGISIRLPSGHYAAGIREIEGGAMMPADDPLR